MNKHVNKNKRIKPAAQNRAIAEVDHMPKTVATAMLLAPGSITNRQRKNLQEARCTCYHSTLTPRTTEVKLSSRFLGSTWDQLHKWLRRVVSRRADIQRAYTLAHQHRERLLAVKVDPKQPAELASVQTQIALFNRVIAEFDVRAAKLDIFRDCVESEIDRRTSTFLSGLRAAAPTVAAILENTLGTAHR